jgi:UDP-N-acetylglucosamine acyltransferase
MGDLTRIHPSAVVDSTSHIDSTATIAAFTVIEAGVTIGPETVVGPHCHFLSGTVIGAGCDIHSGVVLGGTPQDRTFTGQPSGCEIGDGTTLREHVTIHRGTAPGSVTRVGQRCLLMVGSHVGHNCVVDDDVTLVNGVLLGGYVHVGSRAVLSGHVGVHQFVRIGEGAMVGVLSQITQDVLPHFMVNGAGINVGINKTGLRRNGAESTDIDDVQRAYRILCRERHSLPVARELLQATVQTRYGQSILSFLLSDSRRGFHLQGVGRRTVLNAEAADLREPLKPSTTVPAAERNLDTCP